MRLTACAILIFWGLATSSFSQSNEWVGKLGKVVPLTTQETTVVQFFGVPQSRIGHEALYKTASGELRVIYSSGSCGSQKLKNPGDDYNVPKGTVIYADFSPRRGVPFRSLIKNLEIFEREVVKDVADLVIYRSKELGVSYEVDRGNVTEVSLFPSGKHEHLQCTSVPAIE